MAEFKKLSEVEVLETSSDNATVLVEEGGDIKRVPKKEVGGAGGYILALSESNCEIGNGEILCHVNYDELYDVLIAGGAAWIDVACMVGMHPIGTYLDSGSILPSFTNQAGALVSIPSWTITDVGMFVYLNLFGDTVPVCLPNGSHNLDPIEK